MTAELSGMSYARIALVVNPSPEIDYNINAASTYTETGSIYKRGADVGREVSSTMELVALSVTFT